jgi:hypothetical protein
LSGLSKNQIKAKLANGLGVELESILKNHRKAVLKLELERIDVYKNTEADELLSKYKSAIADNDVDKAIELQNSIFEKINGQVVSPDFLKQMQVLRQEKFAPLILKNSSLNYMLNIRKALIAYDEIKALEKIVPGDPKVKYNKISIKINLWWQRAIKVYPEELEKEISNLKNYGISNSLISRMLVNLNIIKADYAMRRRDYDTKDDAVKYIKKNYEKFGLSDFDYLSLSQFFSYYAKAEDAVELLEDKVQKIEVNEDLLFYYLNLTITDKELTKEENYRTILLNAYNLNSERFCKLFNAFDKGGVTFQLLDNNYLRNSYCENCVKY